jgi:hypothetical protein
MPTPAALPYDGEHSGLIHINESAESAWRIRFFKFFFQCALPQPHVRNAAGIARAVRRQIAVKRSNMTKPCPRGRH